MKGKVCIVTGAGQGIGRATAIEFARRGWLLPRSIDRVYVVDKAVTGLGYRPAHDFASLFRRPVP